MQQQVKQIIQKLQSSQFIKQLQTGTRNSIFKVKNLFSSYYNKNKNYENKIKELECQVKILENYIISSKSVTSIDLLNNSLSIFYKNSPQYIQSRQYWDRHYATNFPRA